MQELILWTQVIYINAIKNTIDMRVSDEELAWRRKDWAPREPKVKSVRTFLLVCLCLSVC